MTDQPVWQPPHVDGARDIMRAAIEFCRLGESFDAYRELAKQVSDELDEPQPNHSLISKREEDLTSISHGIVDDIVSICKWEDEPSTSS